MTPQGRAIDQVTKTFGDGKTLPFTPCKKGYVPFHTKTGDRMYACPHHNKARRKRVLCQENVLSFRAGEVDLRVFWKFDEKFDPCNGILSLTDVPP
jgi:hypothetical protein